MSSAAASPRAGDGDREPLIVITDALPYGDDAMALIMLLSSPRFTITGIVAASGNDWSDRVARNVSALLARLGRSDIPVAIGDSEKDFGERRTLFASDRGKSVSRAYAGALAREAPAAYRADDKALDDLARSILDAPGRTSIVLLAPATSLARMMRAQPRLPEAVKHVYVMGGALDRPGNASPEAEFNFWFDPVAAEAVLQSGAAVTLVPLDATHGAVLSGRLIPRTADSAAARYFDDYLKSRPQSDEVPMWDEVLAAVVVDPSVAIARRIVHLHVENDPGPAYGRVRAVEPPRGAAPTEVVDRVDPSRLVTAFQRALATETTRP